MSHIRKVFPYSYAVTQWHFFLPASESIHWEHYVTFSKSLAAFQVGTNSLNQCMLIAFPCYFSMSWSWSHLLSFLACKQLCSNFLLELYDGQFLPGWILLIINHPCIYYRCTSEQFYGNFTVPFGALPEGWAMQCQLVRHIDTFFSCIVISTLFSLRMSTLVLVPFPDGTNSPECSGMVERVNTFLLSFQFSLHFVVKSFLFFNLAFWNDFEICFWFLLNVPQ